MSHRDRLPTDELATDAMCPALLIAAPASGQGKTTVTAAMAHWHRSQGRRVRVFKTGPDFLDPMVLELASGAPVRQLDLWMGGPGHCASLLHAAASESDLILVEGVMGLHDGTPSSADLALHFDLPVLAVIDASAMAQTFGALAHGLSTYRPGLRMAGVLANRVGSVGHAEMLRESLPAGSTWYGAMPRDATFALPSRHLGLVQASEVDDIGARIAGAAEALASRGELPMPAPMRFKVAAASTIPRSLAGVKVAIARDAAFSFIYPSNVDTLLSLGAEVNYFSPLADEPVPDDASALWLPGGYPELHLATFAASERSRESIRAHHAADRPLLAECGGLLSLLQSMTDVDGRSAEMFGLLPGNGVMERGLVNLGMHGVVLPEGELRGHTFHHGRMDSALEPAASTNPQRHHGKPEGVFRDGRLLATFMHLYFPSNPAAISALLHPGMHS